MARLTYTNQVQAKGEGDVITSGTRSSQDESYTKYVIRIPANGRAKVAKFYDLVMTKDEAMKIMDAFGILLEKRFPQ